MYLIIYMFIHAFVLVQAVLTSYHRLGNLKNNYFSQFWKLEVQNHGISMVGFW